MLLIAVPQKCSTGNIFHPKSPPFLSFIAYPQPVDDGAFLRQLLTGSVDCDRLSTFYVTIGLRAERKKRAPNGAHL